MPPENDIETSSFLSTTPTESTPLLPGQQLPHNKNDENESDGSWSGEFRWLVSKSLPVIGTYLLQYSLQLASVFTLGHLVTILIITIRFSLVIYDYLFL